MFGFVLYGMLRASFLVFYIRAMFPGFVAYFKRVPAFWVVDGDSGKA